MNNLKFYYRFEPIAVDYSSERDVKKHSKELNAFNDLSEQFHKLRIAFDAASNERADIQINILPDILGITEICVYHRIKRKLFSKAIKKQCFFLCITRYEPPNETHALYEYETTSIEEIERIFNELITNQIIPNLNIWKRRL